MIHLFYSAVAAAVTHTWETQIRKAKDAHRFIIEAIQSERDELDKLKDKYVSLLNKEPQERGRGKTSGGGKATP